MTESLTARFGLRQYSAPTDGFSRSDYDADNAAIEALGAIDKQGTRAARPAPGVVGTYYTVIGDGNTLLNGTVYRDNGTSWDVVGAKVEDAVFRPSATNTVPATIQGLAGQTADLFQLKSSIGAVLGKITAAGGLVVTPGGTSFGGAPFPNTALTALAVGATGLGLVVQGATFQSADLQRWVDSSGGLLAKVSSDGSATFKALATLNGDVLTTGGSQTITGLKTFSTIPTTGQGDVATLGGTQTFNGNKTHSGTETFNGPENHTGTESHTGTETHSGTIRHSNAVHQPVIGSDGTTVVVTGGSFTPGSPVCGLVFTAPPSGKVFVNLAAYMQQAVDGNEAVTSFEIRTGGTIGSGTVQVAASGDRSLVCGEAVTSGSPARLQATRRVLVVALTPGATYNVRVMLASTPSGSNTCFHRELVVEPIL